MNFVTKEVEARLRKDFKHLGREIEKPEGWGHPRKNYEEAGALIGDIVVTILKVITGTRGPAASIEVTPGIPVHK